MLKGLLALASVALTIFALADCIQTSDDQVRGIPRWGWIILVVLVPWIGPITWLLVGKDRFLRSDEPGPGRTSGGGSGLGGGPGTRPGMRPTGGRPSRRSGPMAPDEDPEFLRKLDEDIRREKRERRRREDEDGDDSSGGRPEED
jgi:hypothetical protein